MSQPHSAVGLSRGEGRQAIHAIVGDDGEEPQMPLSVQPEVTAGLVRGEGLWLGAVGSVAPLVERGTY